ncbi:hypothetical protein GCM10022381_41570 [Leifsonia kafniensis]|uniref:Bacterial type II secretion system protein E domain-containing protein n=1 Tax=Leifsonia kafniensis TaxID=475957 RepID=A0ABP7L6A8_9MICO
MDKPIFEIPVTPPGDDYNGLEGWAPAPAPAQAAATDLGAERPTFESLLAELTKQSAAPLPSAATPVGSGAPASSWSLEALAADAAAAEANDSIESIDALFAKAEDAPTAAFPVIELDDSAPYLIPVPPTAFSPRFDLAPPSPPAPPAPLVSDAPVHLTADPPFLPNAAAYLIPLPHVAVVEADVPAAIPTPALLAEPSTETTAFAVQSSAAAEFPPQSAIDGIDQAAPRIVPTGRRAALSLEADADAAAEIAEIVPETTLLATTPLATPLAFVAPAAVEPAVVAPALAVTAPSARQQADPDLVAALHEVVHQNASDLHVTVGAPPSIRVDGGLRALEGANTWMVDKVTSALYSLLTEEQKEKFEREHELDFAFAAGGARFRVNYYLQRNSVGGAFRLIPREIKQLKDLGVPETVGRFSTLPRGLVLVTGPTGSGKSTTLAALIDLVNRTRADHIVTVEDPIEFLHHHQKSLVNQREVGHDTHSFAAALKHVLRQDPDVILIGELRDLETISVALTAAETGHLVFATLHTQDAAQTIDRVIDVFPPHQQGQVRAQLAATLQGVVCQTLVKKASGRGRVVATEILTMTPAIANLVREGKTYQIASMMQAGRDSGMHTMDQHLADLVNSGQITRRAAEEKAHDPAGLTRLIHRVESPTDASARAIAASDIDFGDAYSQVSH